MFFIAKWMIIIETQYPQPNKKVKDNERWKKNKVEERLNLINNSVISQKQRIEFRFFKARCIGTTWEVYFLISLKSPIGAILRSKK